MINKFIFVLTSITVFTTYSAENEPIKRELKQGVLIAIEGIDGAGKSTFASELNSFLQKQGFSTLLTREPGDTELGKEIRAIIQTQKQPITTQAQFLLFAADRAEHFEKVIKPALRQNKIVISDRLSDSSLAYQGYGQGVDINQIKSINNWVMQGIKPDWTFFIDIDIDTALERCNKRGGLSAYEKKDLLTKIAAGFKTIYSNRKDVSTLDGKKTTTAMVVHAYEFLIAVLEGNRIIL